jgi:hypothetical protein
MSSVALAFSHAARIAGSAASHFCSFAVALISISACPGDKARFRGYRMRRSQLIEATRRTEKAMR